MLSTERARVAASSKAIWLMILVVAISFSMEAALLLGIVTMLGGVPLILPALAAAILSAGLVVTMMEFATLAKEH